MATLVLSDGTTLSSTILVPDLFIAGTTMFDFAASGITIVTTGITNADRMSFAYPQRRSPPDGRDDYVLQLNDAAPVPVPEPSSAILLLTALSAAPFALRKRMSRLNRRG